MTISEKIELLDKLNVAYNRAHLLKAMAEKKKSSQEIITGFDDRKTKLKEIIDKLLQDIYENLTCEANELAGKIDESNQGLNKNINEIEKDLNTAKNFEKALGYLDDVICIAAGIIK